MSRVTAPVSKLSRAISSTPATRTNPLLDSTSHNAGAVLMPKYAELLRNRSNEHSDSSRGLTTTHRPTPQPSLANRSKPLMQTFHSASTSSSTPSHLDAAVLPSMSDAAATDSGPRVPLLPDNYIVGHRPFADAVSAPFPAIVAANPDNVLSAAPLSSIEGIALDGIELKFIHEQPAEKDEGTMLTDLWKGMVDDVFGAGPKKA